MACTVQSGFKWFRRLAGSTVCIRTFLNVHVQMTHATSQLWYMVMYSTLYAQANDRSPYPAVLLSHLKMYTAMGTYNRLILATPTYD